MNLQKEFPKRLLKARLEAGYSQSKLAARIKAPQTWLSHLENGRRLPSLLGFVSLVKALHTSADFLIGNVNNNKPKKKGKKNGNK